METLANLVNVLFGFAEYIFAFFTYLVNMVSSLKGTNVLIFVLVVLLIIKMIRNVT